MAETKETLEFEFANLVKQWRDETIYLSFVSDMVNHPVYQRIVAIGESTLPLILQEFGREPGHWFVALHEIASEKPPQSVKTLDQSIEWWLNWGKDKRYL